MVVAGEPGIGKSRLVEEIENLARARKIAVLHGRFLEQDRTFAYQGFCEVIQEYFRSHESGTSGERPDFSDLAPDLVTFFPVLSEISELRVSRSGESPAAPEPRRADDRTYIFELLARTITRIAGGRPLVLVFENLHSAELSLDALQYVVRRLGPTPTLIVATYRQTEIDKRHPLMKLLDSFADDPRHLQLSLGPFSGSEHRRFIETIVGSSELASGLAERLYEATEANPFFTRELLRSLIDSEVSPGRTRASGLFPERCRSPRMRCPPRSSRPSRNGWNVFPRRCARSSPSPQSSDGASNSANWNRSPKARASWTTSSTAWSTKD